MIKNYNLVKGLQYSNFYMKNKQKNLSYLSFSKFRNILQNEEEMIIRDNIKEFKKMELNNYYLISLLEIINIKTETSLTLNYSDLIRRRLSAINQEAYTNICQDFIKEKKNIIRIKTQEITKEYSLNTENFYQDISKLQKKQIDKLTFQLYPVQFESNFIPTRELSKEAFEYYSQCLLREFKLMLLKLNNYNMSYSLKEYLYDRIMITQQKASDDLQNKYKITSKQCKFLIYKHNLLEEDPEISLLYAKTNGVLKI
jgi:hypothetical protein